MRLFPPLVRAARARCAALHVMLRDWPGKAWLAREMVKAEASKNETGNDC
jgi:hypothetical protein